MRRYEPFFGKWRLTGNILGKGAFGKVYEITCTDEEGNREICALKYMHIPSGTALRSQIEQQPDMDAVRSFFEAQLDRVKDEIRILRKCAGHRNIVRYEQHMIAENPGEGGIGWDILIRMERLYPITSFFARPEASQLEVIRMWMDIANALVCCGEHGVIHRDVKPTNILVSDSGVFKLSDFGAARRNLQGLDASTRIGTEQYMAPEVYKGLKYDARADLYSLGCVAYYYLNRRRRPFMPPYPQALDAAAMEKADETRILGKKRIPGISGVPGRINRILLRSLSYRPQDRYRSADELRRALEKMLQKQGNELGVKRLDPQQQKSAEASRPNLRQKVVLTTFPVQSFQKSRSALRTKLPGRAWIGAILLAGGTAGLLAAVMAGRTEKAADPATEQAVTELVKPQMTAFNMAALPDSGTEDVQTMPESETTEAQTAPDSDAKEMLPRRDTDQKETETYSEGAAEQAVTEMISAENAEETDMELPAEKTETVPQNCVLVIDRPYQGERVDRVVGLIGTVLVPAGHTLPVLSARLLENGQVREEIPIPDVRPVGENVLQTMTQRAIREHMIPDAAGFAEGFEFAFQWEISDMPDGAFTLEVCAGDREGKREAFVQKILIRESGRMLTGEEVRSLHQEILPLQGETEGMPDTDHTESSFRYEDGEHGFTLQIDTLQADGRVYPAGDVMAAGAEERAGQFLTVSDGHVVITGQLREKTGTAVGPLVMYDGELMTLAKVGELGGSAEFLLFPGLDTETADRTSDAGKEADESGEVPQNDGEITAGWQLDLDLSCFGEGEHTLALVFNLVLPGKEPEYIDMPGWRLQTMIDLSRQ